MDKFSFAQNGVVRLPPGFRFQPTDEELVFRYLKCKVFSCPLPASIIPEVNVCNYDPWDLPGDLEQERNYVLRFAQIHNASSLQNSFDQVEKWVICRIFLKPGSAINNNVIIQSSGVNKVENIGTAQPRLLDFRRGYEIDLDRVSSSCSSSSSSRSITEVSSREADHHEEGRPCSKC
ncbi:hypothetical protein CJ030_MR4G028386 [Morella rubra]|uniref:NAC domain-containing protein n=1 Tax=Morella rubra TaxID=262757 RepID=A0A6A1VXK5_9ROSI|nr:hypothetical protein CJ030_MR4G028386 [Morella rubra]